MRHWFKATKQRIHKKRIFAFDIESYDSNKGFLVCSLIGLDRYGNDYKKNFFTPEDFVKELKTNIVFRNSEIYATNLGYDFFGTFFNLVDIGNFVKCERGSALLSAKTWFKGNTFVPSSKHDTKSKKTRASLEFRDSLNYAKMSVEEMGKLVKFNKMESPVFGKSWKQMTKCDQDYMVDYNYRDSEITYKFMKFLISSFEGLGASVNLTIGSTAMSLFKNKYLGDVRIPPNKIKILRRLFLAFYGGRTETFARGTFKDYFYYDFNSLYPSIMQNEEFPDPRFQSKTYRGSRDDYIMHCEGVSEIEIDIPFMKYPPLPFRDSEGKVIFPYGHLKGSWSHLEIRYAISLGCKISKVYESIYYVRNIRPFEDFVKDLYTLRQKYQSEEEYNPMEKVVKLFMNNLFGKFGEKFDEKGTTIHKDAITEKDIEEATKIESIGDYFRVIGNQDPKAHCIPIWAIYVTAHGRVKLHKYITKYNAIYCDTDSLITNAIIPTSKVIGDLKLEMDVKRGCTIRPKMYSLFSRDNKDYVKMKGLAVKYQPKTLQSFTDDFVTEPIIQYHKFTKFKEAIRNGTIVPNQIILTRKKFSLEDSKRDWRKKKFNVNSLQFSDPLFMEKGDKIKK